jgi:integrase
MAWLEQTKSGVYHIAFRYGGQKFKKSLRTRDAHTANARLHRIDENILLVESGRLVVPENVNLGTFLLSDGKLNGSQSRRAKRQIRTLGEFCEAFLASIPSGALEENTVRCMKTHVRHLYRVFGKSFQLLETELEDLQRYVDRRSGDKGIRGKTLSTVTIKKEITTLRTVWIWAMDAGYVARPLSLKGLRYPKTNEKPAFQILAEIERRIALNNVSEDQENELWASLFLTTDEIRELLMHVRETARHSFLHPMFVFAAHTGARRSEILRSQLDDIDFNAGNITIREKKRVRGRITTRSVPLSPMLRKVLHEWLQRHPGGSVTFSLGLNVDRSKKTRVEISALTRDEAHDHFKRALSGTKWAKARGWHVFRHSFCSNCAAAGVDQRIINAWVGHQTEEMVKRYRHLIPDQQQRAIAGVFTDE